MSVRLDHGGDQLDEVHEINVTPFIDVILVLLIIFMIAAPLATVDISVDLPAANAETAPRPDKPLFLTLKSDLSLALDNDTVGRAALAAAAENFRTQREPRDALILLEAALAAREPAAAVPALQWLESSGFESDRFRRLALKLKAIR